MPHKMLMVTSSKVNYGERTEAWLLLNCYTITVSVNFIETKKSNKHGCLSYLQGKEKDRKRKKRNYLIHRLIF